MKRGVSTVVAGVLIVLITVFGVSLLWLGLGTFIDTDLSTFDTRLSIVTSTGYTFYDPANETLMVQVESSGTKAADYVQMIITLNDGTELISTHYAPFLNSRKTLQFNANDTYIHGSAPDTVAVAPIFVHDGKAILGRRTPDVRLGQRSETVTFYAQATNNEPPLSPIGSSVDSSSENQGEDSPVLVDLCDFSTGGCLFKEAEILDGNTEDHCFGTLDQVSGDYAICTCEDLQRIDTNETTLARDYILMNDIDCSMTNPTLPGFNVSGTWGNGKGFNSIGGNATTECNNGLPMTGCSLFIPGPIDTPPAFTGSFNGNGKTISELYINRPEEHAALFDTIASDGVDVVRIHNLNLDSVKIYGRDAASLVSSVAMGNSNSYVLIEDISANGIVDARELPGYSSGGLISKTREYNRLRRSSFTGDVYGTYNVGGLIAIDYGSKEIFDSHFSGNVVGDRGSVGGLVGFAIYPTTIMNSSSQGSVIGVDYVGGLVGRAWPTPTLSTYSTVILGSYSSANVEGNNNVGGLVGEHNFGQYGEIYNSYFKGSVEGNNNVGGLVGKIVVYFNMIGQPPRQILFNSYSRGDVTGNVNVKALVGSNSGTLSSSYFPEEAVECIDFEGNDCKDIEYAIEIEQLQNQTFLVASGWDFTQVWEFGPDSYPRLRWE